jgi:hypothetical protein
MKKTKKTNKFDLKKVYKQPKVAPFQQDIDIVLSNLIDTEEYEEQVKETYDQEVSIKIANFIYFGNVTHKVKVDNINFYRVEIEVDNKTYARWGTTKTIRNINNSFLRVKEVKEGLVELP